MNIEESLKRAYLLGWQESGEGYNHENPTGLEETKRWQDQRDDLIDPIAASMNKTYDELLQEVQTLRGQLEESERRGDELTTQCAKALPEDLMSHKRSWLSAMARLVDLETDEVDIGYWRHEWRAMRNMYDAIERGES